VPLDFLDDVLLKDLTLEAPERVLKGFTVLNVDLGQRITSFMANDETSMLTVSRCPRAAAESRFAAARDCEGLTAGEQEMRDLVRSRIADYKTPERILFLSFLPKGLTGK